MLKKKAFYIITLLVLCLVLITTGLSMWIISNKRIIKPQDATKEVVKKYLSLSIKENTYIYNRNVQFPQHKKLDCSSLSYYYKKTSEDETSWKICDETNGPIEAGEYDMYVSYVDNKNNPITVYITDESLKFVISKKELSISWFDTEIAWNGNPYLPQGTISGVIDDDVVNLSISYNGSNIGPIAAGTHIATLSLDNSNYCLESYVKEFRIRPLKQVLSVVADSEQSTTYNGALQNPVVSQVYLQTFDDDDNMIDGPTLLDSSEYTLSYSYPSGTKPIDASSYSVTIIASYISCDEAEKNGTTDINFTINKATPIIKTHPVFTSIYEGELDGSYVPTVLEAGKATFNDNEIAGSFTFKEIPSEVTRKKSGKKYYYNATGTTDANGYTTNVSYTFKPTDTKNFETITISNLGKITIKPIAFSDSTYYGSIEDALDQVKSGTIHVIAEVATGKRRIRSSCTISSGVTLQFLYGTSTTIISNQTSYSPSGITRESRTYALNSTTNRKNLIYLDANVEVTNEGKIIIGGIISSGKGGNGPNCQTCADYAEIIMKTNSKLTNKDGSYLINYGSIKNESTTSKGGVFIKNGATMQMPFVLIEHRGGSVFSGIAKSQKGSAFNRFFFQNISSELTFEAGGIFYAYANLFANDKDNETTIPIVGTDSSFLICLHDNAYFKANYNNSTKVNKIDFYGDMELNALVMTVVGQKMSTQNVYFPLSWYFDVSTHVLPGSSKAEVKINQDMKLLPGAKLRIGSGVEATAKRIFVYDTFTDVNVGCSTLYPTNKGSGRLYVNGKLTITGSIAGLVETEVNGAQLVINSNAKTNDISYELASSSGSSYFTSVTWSENSKSFIFYPYTSSGTSNNAISGTTGTMYSRNGGWYDSSMSINYESFGGTLVPAKTGITIDGKGHIVTTDDLPVISKDYYSFDGWYLDDAYSQRISENFALYYSVTLYAKWTANEYSISYIDKYIDNSNPDNPSTNNNPSTFTIETASPLSEAVNGDYVFGGWFIDEECTIKISMLIGQDLIERLSNGNLNIYALWYPQGTNRYVITFENDFDSVTCAESDTQVVTSSYDWSSYQLPVMTGYDYEVLVSKYFDGWYYGDTLVETITNDMFENVAGTYRLTLRAKWIDKNILELKFKQDTQEYYYKPGQSFTIPSFELQHNASTNSGEVLINWVDDRGITSNPDSQITLNNQKTLTATIKKYIELSIGTNDYTSAKVRLSQGRGYIVTVENNIPTAKAFNNEEFSNGASIYITVESTIEAWWKKEKTTLREKNGATIEFEKGTPTSNNLTDAAVEYLIASDCDSIKITPVGKFF